MPKNNLKIKVDGALGAMVIEDQPTHSIYNKMLADFVKYVNILMTVGRKDSI